MKDSHLIAVLAGDGIGPEVVEVALPLLTKVSQAYGLSLEFQKALVGGAAIDACGEALPEKTLEVCRQARAIFFGSVGGPQWEHLPPDQQPERAALLPLRKIFGLYANLRPALCYPELVFASPLKSERIPSGFDVLCVRELTGGIYFGQPKKTISIDSGERAVDTMAYETQEIERIAHLAFQAATHRQKKVTLVDKANVLETSLLWRKTVKQVALAYPDITLEFVYVDNAAMQVCRSPQQYDVLLCENMFGDIISDELAAVTGSLGLLPSASLGEGSFGLYEPSGGSAPDIAGQGLANPIAQILSGALMLRYSFNKEDAACALEKAVQQTLREGIRTADIASTPDEAVSTKEMAQEIDLRLDAILI